MRRRNADDSDCLSRVGWPHRAFQYRPPRRFYLYLMARRSSASEYYCSVVIVVEATPPPTTTTTITKLSLDGATAVWPWLIRGLHCCYCWRRRVRGRFAAGSQELSQHYCWLPVQMEMLIFVFVGLHAVTGEHLGANCFVTIPTNAATTIIVYCLYSWLSWCG